MSCREEHLQNSGPPVEGCLFSLISQPLSPTVYAIQFPILKMGLVVQVKHF
jgi:hypothetical protein